MTGVLEFVGEPFDAVAAVTPPAVGPPAVEPAGVLLPAVLPTAGRVVTVRPDPAAPPQAGPDPIAALRAAVVGAHISALRAQESLQRRLLTAHPAAAHPAAAYPAAAYAADNAVDHLVARPVLPAPPSAATRPAPEGAFRPLARTPVTTLDAAGLRRLAAGDVSGVFGPAYNQNGGDHNGAAPDVRLTDGPLALTAVRAIELRGGAAGAGRVVADVDGDVRAATAQAASLFALYSGLHLCLADARLTVEAAGATGPVVGLLELDVREIDLLPRPWLRATAGVAVPGGGTAEVQVTVTVAERPGTPVGPECGGRVPWLGRRSAAGEPVLLSEFHMAHLARGDQGVALGPEFAHYTGRKATRLPTGGLLLTDRVVTMDGERGRLDGARYETEYDSPADSWYYADTANASMPHCVYMETSLQAALLGGYYLGPTLTEPDATLSLRNLGGTATVLREVDLRDTTIRQSSQLQSTTILSGSSLQQFAYSLAVDGEPFYRGETMFGYFGDDALAHQTGLDAGRTVPTWLDSQDPRPPVRTLDLAARRADEFAPLCSRGTLALLDEIDVVDGGGRHGAGYLHAVRAIDAGDWFFRRHFHLDPVIPGSLGVESVIQAMQEWLLASGQADHLRDPEFVVPVGVPFTWKYRGQFLPTDATSTLEVHVQEVRSSPGRVRVIAEASMWKPGLRIYELDGIAVELREPGASR